MRALAVGWLVARTGSVLEARKPDQRSRLSLSHGDPQALQINRGKYINDVLPKPLSWPKNDRRSPLPVDLEIRWEDFPKSRHLHRLALQSLTRLWLRAKDSSSSSLGGNSIAPHRSAPRVGRTGSPPASNCIFGSNHILRTGVVMPIYFEPHTFRPLEYELLRTIKGLAY